MSKESAQRELMQEVDRYVASSQQFAMLSLILCLGIQSWNVQ